jgi:glycosyltransferase A (GT-A) superfamily protein (DUF2064 family)
LAELASPRAVLIMARAPRADRDPGGLGALLGSDRLAELRRVLLARAIDWASSVAPTSVHVAYEPSDGRSELRDLVGPEVNVFPQNGAGFTGRLANASALALGGGDGPLVVGWPELASWRPEHASAALTDLADGYDLAVGPFFDRGFYLIAMARPLPALFALPDATWRSSDSMMRVLGAAHAAGVAGGMLRAERALRTPGDVRAALADPLLDPELRALLDSGV